MIRVLVVDDSATMRALIVDALRRDPGIAVVGEATDPVQARSAIKALNPDVLTLDIEMPQMNGLDFLERIMRLRPMPVVMVSTLTSRGADATLRALELGAFDCVAKPRLADREGFDRLVPMVRAAAGAKVRPANATLGRATPVTSDFHPNGRLAGDRFVHRRGGGVADHPVAIPGQLSADGHHPAHAGHLHQQLCPAAGPFLCAAEVREAVDGAVLAPGRIFLAPGGETHLEVSGTGPWRCRLQADGPVNGHRPSVDVLFASVAKAAGAKALGVILTGMGKDGARGLLAMRQAGARTLGQDEASSVVYGMPRSAFELQAVMKQVSLNAMAGEILEACHTRHGGR